MPSDKEQMALHLNGKKNRLKRLDFVAFGTQIGLSESLINKLIDKYDTIMLKNFVDFTSTSFLPEDLKERFIELLNSRFNVFY